MEMARKGEQGRGKERRGGIKRKRTFATSLVLPWPKDPFIPLPNVIRIPLSAMSNK